MSEIPSSWIRTELENIAADTDYPIGDGDHGQIRPSDYKTEGIPYIRVSDIGWGSFTKDKLVYISKSTHLNNQKSKLVPGDILIAKTGATIGKCCIVPNEITEANTTSSVGKVTINKKMTFPKWILYYFLTRELYDYLWSISERTAQPGFNNRDLKKFIIPLAPIKEQERILKKLDKLLVRVDEAKARLDKIPVIIKRFRQSVLNAAVTGELTKDWREKEGSNIDEWDKKIFNDFCKLQRGHDLPINNIRSGNYPVVTSGGIAGYHSEFKSVGPCLVTGRSGSVGNVHYYQVEKYWPHNTVLYVKDFCSNYPKFVYYFFLQFDFKSFSSSTAVPTLDRKKLFNENIIVPKYEEQKEIVKRVEALFKKADEIEERYKKAKAYVDKLTQSILAKAFRGELVPQDPNDEPAEKLLERVREERELLNMSKFKKGGKNGNRSKQ